MVIDASQGKNSNAEDYPASCREMIDQLDRQINDMLVSKTHHSRPYEMPEHLPEKSYRALRDLEENHDNSWAVEIYRKNAHRLEKTALLYRGNRISYKEMFANAFSFARSFKALGIHRDDEVPVMVSNMPEYAYVFLGLSLIGARMNTVGMWFDENYLADIFRNSGSHCLLVSDDCYKVAKSPVERTASIETVVMFSVMDSLPRDQEGKPYNPFEEIDRKYNDFSSKVQFYQSSSTRKILDKNAFLALGKECDGQIVEDMTLDDVASITYTSGTTKPGYPKGCIHSNRNYVAISRFKESDVSGMPAMKDIIALALLPSYTQTVLTTAYSDPLYLGCTVALEPFYSEDFFIETLDINKPNYVVNTPGCFVKISRLLDSDPEWKCMYMPYLQIPIIVGEGMTLGERYYLDRIASQHRFGIDKMPFHMPITYSFGGGSSENGGIFITLFVSLQEKSPKYWINKEHVQLKTLPLADVDVLDSEGLSCKPGETGMLVANSPCNQIGYVDDSFNPVMHITDATGKKWYSAGAYAIKNRFGEIRIVGRPDSNIITSKGKTIPMYMLEDLIGSDYRNILTAIIVKVMDSSGCIQYVCHIEKQPDARLSDNQILKECAKRLSDRIDPEILHHISFKFRGFFPLAPSGKRDTAALIAEGCIENCIPFDSIQK